MAAETGRFDWDWKWIWIIASLFCCEESVKMKNDNISKHELNRFRLDSFGICLFVH